MVLMKILKIFSFLYIFLVCGYKCQGLNTIVYEDLTLSYRNNGSATLFEFIVMINRVDPNNAWAGVGFNEILAEW